MSRGKTAVIVGAQWGDEGKGKIVDVLSEHFTMVARYAGGHNAGHTVVVDGKKYVLQLVPCGVLRNGTKGVIGNGVVLDPIHFLKEVETLRQGGIKVEGNLFISNRAQVILPYHRMIELAAENAPGRVKIGTTSRGIGPSYEDKMGRRGLRVIDLLDKELLKKHIENACAEKNMIAHALFNSEPIDADSMYREYSEAAKKIAPFVADTAVILNKAIADGESVMFEGAQATMLDIDHGTYPFVTSSSTTAGGAVTGTGVPPTKIHGVLGVAKAYSTRVGGGPFPTEMTGKLAETIRARGKEYGATTGRPRRCGWFDGVVLRYAVRINGFDTVALTKLDVLDQCETLKLCTGYRWRGDIITDFPGEETALAELEPVYEDVEGWMTSTAGAKNEADLPAKARHYLERLEELIGVPFCLVSTGAQRDETILCEDSPLLQWYPSVRSSIV